MLQVGTTGMPGQVVHGTGCKGMPAKRAIASRARAITAAGSVLQAVRVYELDIGATGKGHRCSIEYVKRVSWRAMWRAVTCVC